LRGGISLYKPVARDFTGGLIPLSVWAYVFITTRYPKRVLQIVRAIEGVAHADALFGSPDVIAIVSGSDIADMDAVIDRIAEVPDIAATDSKVARWLDGIHFARVP
jgi:DNA-binding Lrp family transcriptional regulator